MNTVVMAFLCPLAAAVLIALAPPRRRHGASPTASRMTRALVLRHRVVRLARLDWLMQRERVLSDFLVRARTETPIFDDDTTQTLAGVLAIGPVAVTNDFIGGCIIRARVRNLQHRDAWFVLQAHLRGADATASSASLAVMFHADETREVELLSPTRQKPQALVWTVTTL